MTRRSLFLGLTLALAGIARSLGLTNQPESALARHKKHHKGGNGGRGILPGATRNFTTGPDRGALRTLHRSCTVTSPRISWRS